MRRARAIVFRTKNFQDTIFGNKEVRLFVVKDRRIFAANFGIGILKDNPAGKLVVTVNIEMNATALIIVSEINPNRACSAQFVVYLHDVRLEVA